MIEFKKISLSDFLASPRPSRERLEREKSWKECYCVANLCKALNIDGFISSSYEEPVDVALETINGTKENFQVTELKEPGPRHHPDNINTNLYQNCDNFFDEFIVSYTKKNNDSKYSPASIKKVSLLIYANNNSYSETNCEFSGVQIQPLKEHVSNSNFKKVYILFANDLGGFILK